jgi:hypothetical protein
MTEERVKLKLSAILTADVTGYSRLMGAPVDGIRSCFFTSFLVFWRRVRRLPDCRLMW